MHVLVFYPLLLIIMYLRQSNYSLFLLLLLLLFLFLNSFDCVSISVFSDSNNLDVNE